ncbi:MAG: hypothetical protein O6848_08770 [Bacteroidetes bacterium]|nr:hypothetical protein [Bacteroidota bacterium]
MNTIELKRNDEPMISPLLMKGGIRGQNAHVNPAVALEDLNIEITGRKILNTPYTIWQCLKHLNHWQEKYLKLLQGEDIYWDCTWQEGWESSLNAKNQEQLNQEIKKFSDSLFRVEDLMIQSPQNLLRPMGCYTNGFQVIQALSSHISYHIGEIVLLRRIFASWPPPSDRYVW